MANNSMPDFPSHNFPSSNTEFGSSSHAPPPPPPPPVRLVILTVPSGCDIMKAIRHVARRSNASLAVQSASGTIASVTLRNIPCGGSSIIVYGPFNILSFTGSYINDHQHTLLPEVTSPPSFSVGTHLSTSDGRVFGGHIGGRVIADSDVILTIFAFKNPEIYNYIPEGEDSDDDDDENEDNNSNNDPGNVGDM